MESAYPSNLWKRYEKLDEDHQLGVHMAAMAVAVSLIVLGILIIVASGAHPPKALHIFSYVDRGWGITSIVVGGLMIVPIALLERRRENEGEYIISDKNIEDFTPEEDIVEALDEKGALQCEPCAPDIALDRALKDVQVEQSTSEETKLPRTIQEARQRKKPYKNPKHYWFLTLEQKRQILEASTFDACFPSDFNEALCSNEGLVQGHLNALTNDELRTYAKMVQLLSLTIERTADNEFPWDAFEQRFVNLLFQNNGEKRYLALTDEVKEAVNKYLEPETIKTLNSQS